MTETGLYRVKAVFPFQTTFISFRHIQFGNLKSVMTLCVLLLMAFLLFNDPFLLLWWPQEPAQVRENI